MDFSVDHLIREHFKDFKAYSTARDDFDGEASVFLDANENPFGSVSGGRHFNRYPDPHQKALKKVIAKRKKVDKNQVMLGNGSDEIIDLCIRLFCEPGIDNILTLAPSYGMFQVAAHTNNVAVNTVTFNEDFTISSGSILKEINQHTKIIFLCSPNNPTGISLERELIESVLRSFNGLVFVDEAYIDFSLNASMVKRLTKFPNLFVCQTFSKAWGLAGIRLGMGFASKEIINWLSVIKPPYNINEFTQNEALKALKNSTQKAAWVREILGYRDDMKGKLKRLPYVKKVYSSDANFLLVRFKKSQALFEFLLDQGVIIRNRNRAILCKDCLRITIGTKKENKTLLSNIEKFYA